MTETRDSAEAQSVSGPISPTHTDSTPAGGAYERRLAARTWKRPSSTSRAHSLLPTNPDAPVTRTITSGYDARPILGLTYSNTLKTYFKDSRAMLVVRPFSPQALTISRLSTYRLAIVLLLTPPVRM